MIKEINSGIALSEAIEIYLASFPASERHSIETIIERINSGKERLLGYYSNNKLLGISLLWDLNFEGVIVLDYFAIDNKFRNQKHGELFFTEIIHTFLAKNQVMILEIENPYNTAKDSIENRRLNFYRKFDCKEFKDYPYSIPALDGSGIVDMRLLFTGNFQDRNLNKEKLNTICLEIYEQMYYLDSNEAKTLLSSLHNNQIQ